jgi:anti-sigma B factor antagonist
MEFSLEVRKVDGVAVLDLNGRLSLGNALLVLRDAVKQTLSNGTNKLVINLGGVTFIDSSGLGELITTHTSVQNARGAMNLLNPGKRIRELLLMTRLQNVFQCFDDESLSVQELKSLREHP